LCLNTEGTPPPASGTAALATLDSLELIAAGDAVDLAELLTVQQSLPFAKLRQYYFSTLDWTSRVRLFGFVMETIKVKVFGGAGTVVILNQHSV
jgi:hypothetical protein